MQRDANWADMLHPESVQRFGVALTERALNAVPFLTGLAPWDQACEDTGGGLDDFWYLVIGGASNVGKTQHMIHLVRQGIAQGFAVVILTMEEPLMAIQRRIYAALSDRLNYYDFAYDRWDREKARVLCESVPTGGKVVVNEELPSYTLESIIGYLDGVRDLLSGRPMIVLLDHLQLVESPGRDIVRASADVNRALRDWSKRNRTLTIALSQLNREGVLNGAAPRRWHLWGGTDIEANATQVVLIDHVAKTVDPERRHLLRLWMLLDKNRCGPDLVAFPVEANLRTSVWRVPEPDEHHLWLDNPWKLKGRSG